MGGGMSLIGFDCDGVLAMFVERMCAQLSARGFEGYSAETIKHWSLERSLSPGAYCVARDLISQPGFCSSLSWYPGMLDLLQQLRDQGHDLVCVTSPWNSPTWMQERSDWLRTQFDASDIIFCSGIRKSQVRLDYLVEDHPGNAAAWTRKNPMGEALLVARPWNTPAAHEWVSSPNVYRLPDSNITRFFS